MLLDDGCHACLEVFASILVRLEIKFRYDSRLIRLAIETPLPALDERAPADRIGEGVATLRIIRAAIDDMTAPVAKVWRVGH